MEGRISKTTRNLYERNMRTLVSPVFDNLMLREIGVARCDQPIKKLAKLSYSRAKQARVVLRLALDVAVRHEVLRAIRWTTFPAYTASHISPMRYGPPR